MEEVGIEPAFLVIGNKSATSVRFALTTTLTTAGYVEDRDFTSVGRGDLDKMLRCLTWSELSVLSRPSRCLADRDVTFREPNRLNDHKRGIESSYLRYFGACSIPKPRRQEATSSARQRC